MFWYVFLMIGTIAFAIIAIIALCIFILSGCDITEVLFVTLIAGVIAVGLGFGANAIENANTTIDTEVIQMEITKCDLTENNGYVIVGDKYLINVSHEEYTCLNVGDVVLVEVTIKTTFGEVTKITTRLKGHLASR